MNGNGLQRAADAVAAHVACAGAGFLLAVLWFDLMFDVQALGHGSGLLAEAALASMAGYYRRVTTDSWPMGALLVVAMAATVAATAWQAARGLLARPVAAAALVLVVLPVALALLRVLPDAVRLGARIDPLDVQSDLARAILWGHVFCFAGMGAFLALQLALQCARAPQGFPRGGIPAS